WVKRGATARAGDTAVTLAEAVPGWKAGDRVIVTGTQAHGAAMTASATEERMIRGIDGARLTLDRPLDRAHLGDGDYRGEVANLSRNVTVESADPAGARGHTMYHHGSAGALADAEFRPPRKRGGVGRHSPPLPLARGTSRGD